MSNRVKVICIETGQTYESTTAMAAALGTVSPVISAAANHPFERTIQGLHWIAEPLMHELGGIDEVQERLIEHLSMRDFLKDDGIPIQCIETGQEYGSVLDAAEQLAIDGRKLKLALDDPNATMSGMHWRTLNRNKRKDARHLGRTRKQQLSTIQVMEALIAEEKMERERAERRSRALEHWRNVVVYRIDGSECRWDRRPANA